MRTNIAIVGCQGHFGEVLQGVPKVTDARVVAWAADDPAEDNAAIARFQARNGAIGVYDDYRRMLDLESIDVVVVTTRYDRHTPVAVECLNRGKHVICEKPVALTLPQLAELRQAAEHAAGRLTTLFAMRFLPPFLLARRLVQEGAIGEPVLVSGQKSYKFGKQRPSFYKDRATYGGSIPWVAIHAIDYMRWTSGLDFTRVMTFQSNKTRPDYPGLEDNACLLFSLANGGSACLNMDYLRPASAPTHGDDRLRIAGSAGVLEVKDCGQRLELVNDRGQQSEVPLPEPGNILVDFAAALRGEREHLIPPEDVFRVTEIALQARASADTGRPIDLAPGP